MIGIITALLRAFPSLERLLTIAIDQHKLYVAEQRRQAKHSRIDDAINNAIADGVSVGEARWSGRDAGAPGVSESGETRTEFHTGSVEVTSRHRSDG